MHIAAFGDIPAEDRQISPTVPAVASVRAKPGLTAAARWQNSVTAGAELTSATVRCSGAGQAES